MCGCPMSEFPPPHPPESLTFHIIRKDGHSDIYEHITGSARDGNWLMLKRGDEEYFINLDFVTSFIKEPDRE